MRNNKYIVISLVVGSVLLFAYVYPQGVNSGIDFFNSKTHLKLPHVPQKSFVLGLDLLGGTHLVYQADLSSVKDNKTDAMAGIRDVIERRVNLFGVSEPLVQIEGSDRLIVELAGIKDVKQAIQLIGETPFLEFKEQKVDFDQIVNAQAKGERLNEEPFQSTGLSGKHLEKADLVFDPQLRTPQVSLKLNSEGAKLFEEITKRNVGKRVAIFLDGSPISIPTVEQAITNGQAVIRGQFTPEVAKLLATRLNSGALPVPIKLISQQTVGASLGSESLQKSLRAGVWGLILVALYMILFYRLPGIVSVIALAVYVLVVLAVYKLLPVTLSLAGIAGFILSLGMAVDANILIFARMREELDANKGLKQSMKDGFARAWLSIRDSHVTTLIGAAVLYIFTASIVKGFALTLGIGVLTSLFTAITVTRSFLHLFTSERFEKNKWLFK